MKVLNVREWWGDLFRSCVHDILLYAEGADITLISDIDAWQFLPSLIAGWGKTIPQQKVYEGLEQCESFIITGTTFLQFS